MNDKNEMTLKPNVEDKTAIEVWNGIYLFAVVHIEFFSGEIYVKLYSGETVAVELTIIDST